MGQDIGQARMVALRSHTDVFQSSIPQSEGLSP